MATDSGREQERESQAKEKELSIFEKAYSGRISSQVRRASHRFASFRNAGSGVQTSSRNLQQQQEALDDEQKNSVLLSKLPAAGFNRLKGMWANREISAGFTSPLSTWTRPYANKQKNDHENGGNNTPKLGTSQRHGFFDPDKSSGEFIQFGRKIVDCPREKVGDYKEQIPSVLILLRNELEQHGGFLVEGVFRIAASFDAQKQYKIEIDKGTFQGCKNQDDVMCMAALLKEFFRTLPVRLLNALPITSLRTGKSDIEKELPEPNLSLFLWLLDLMADIVSHEQINRMNPRAMAIVIAPNLYAAADDATPQDIMQETNGAVNIVETALKNTIAKRRAGASSTAGITETKT